MKAVILAAGKGMRMRPLTEEKPKPLLPVSGRPILEHIFDLLPSSVDEILVVVGYKGEMIREYFGDDYKGKKITYIEQKEQKGTADALFLCKEALGAGRFMLLYADDLHSAESIKKCAEKDLSLLVYPTNTPERFGIVETDDEGKIVSIEEKPEKPKSNLAAVGVYVLDDRIFNYAPNLEKGEYFLTSMIAGMIADYPFYAVETDLWIPIGYPEDLAKAESYLAKEGIKG